MTEPKTTPTAEDYQDALDESIMVNGSKIAMSGKLACEYLDKHWPAIRNALKTAAGCSSLPEWRPISEYPRVDGDVALFLNCDGQQHVMRYVAGNDEELEFWELTGFELKVFYGPHYWKPLDAAPKDIDPAGEGVKNG